MENFSVQWFTAYYVSLGALLISYGAYLLFRTEYVREFLIDAAGHETPPRIWRTILKYLLLFTIPGLILSFLPFSWIELLFSVWCLIIIYVCGQLILMWEHTAHAILENSDQLNRKIRIAAANMISIGIILFLLTYILVERNNPG
jgi:hypothetical protein